MMTIELAKRISKERYDRLCVFSLREHPDGAHVYPVSVYPELAAEPANVFPIHRICHSVIGFPSFDYRRDGSWRTVDERLWMLLRFSHPDFRARVRQQLEELRELVEALGIEFPEPRQMRDFDFIVQSELRRRHEVGYR
ncbi:MAG: hypothetical protein ONA90_01310 [candidate division KSB1 bacterium]|nr:hypothetical protein [candidate division KSB1 bacterium]